MNKAEKNNIDYYKSLLSKSSYREAVNIVCYQNKDKEPEKSYFGCTSYHNKKNNYLKNKDNPDYKIKRPTMNNKTFFGYHIHHIEEDKYSSLSSPETCFKKNYDFNLQKPCNLVYVNLLEHAILHALILIDRAKNGESIETLRSSSNGYDSVFGNIRESHYKVFGLNNCEFDEIADELEKKLNAK